MASSASGAGGAYRQRLAAVIQRATGSGDEGAQGAVEFLDEQQQEEVIQELRRQSVVTIQRFRIAAGSLFVVLAFLMVAFVLNELASLFSFVPLDEAYSAERLAVLLASLGCYIGLIWLVYKWVPAQARSFRAMLLWALVLFVVGGGRAWASPATWSSLWFVPCVPGVCAFMLWYASRELAAAAPMIDGLESLMYKLKAA